MRRGRSPVTLLVLGVVLAVGLPTAARAAEPRSVVLGNGLVEWRWSTPGAVTTSIVDRRTGQRWGSAGPDFALQTALGPMSSASMTVAASYLRNVSDGRQLQVTLVGLGVVVTRTITAYSGVAGFRVETAVRASLPVVLTGARLAQVHTGSGYPAVRHALRAGADWREPGWDGPDIKIGDPHAGTWRASSANAEGAGQWLSLAGRSRRSLFLVTEANDFPSVRTSAAGGVATPVIDYAHDVISLGPFEEQIHVENPGVPVGRVRVLEPDRVVTLPAVFVGMGRADGDEPWQFHKYLTRHRMRRYAHAVTFNSNGTNTPGVSLGAKDGMNQATIAQVAPLAKRLGIDTFILDDGWQEESGDWIPDPARFPGDPNLAKVRATIAPMKLGLWMTPLHFHPDAAVFKSHPGWVCAPVGDALAVYNIADPDSGSNAAGIAQWSRAVLRHVEQRIRYAITQWRVKYFKFDFLAWLDCLGQGDMYDQHDAFVAMLDRVQAAYPDVTLQIDETNDYRLFPFESVVRGPSWFQNGSPAPGRLLHNLWNLSPYVPATSIGQHFLGDRSHQTWPVSTLMAGALLSHLTFFSDLRQLPLTVLDAARPWLDFYRRYNAALTDGVVYPLLADPLAGGWTALQSWDPETGRGALLAFRQDSGLGTMRIALRNVPAGKRFTVREGPTGRRLGTVTSKQLTDGLRVSLPKRGARVMILTPIR